MGTGGQMAHAAGYSSSSSNIPGLEDALDSVYVSTPRASSSHPTGKDRPRAGSIIEGTDDDAEQQDDHDDPLLTPRLPRRSSLDDGRLPPVLDPLSGLHEALVSSRNTRT